MDRGKDLIFEQWFLMFRKMFHKLTKRSNFDDVSCEGKFEILSRNFVSSGMWQPWTDCNQTLSGISPRAGPRDVVVRGALKAEVLNRAAKAARGGSMRGGLNPPLIRGGGSGGLPRKNFKICVSENAFQAILKPIFHIL